MSDLHGLTGTLPWEKQPEESVRHFRVFCYFLDGKKPRTVRAAWRTLCEAEGRPIPERPPGDVERASLVWSWRRRADALDVYRDEERRADAEEARLAARHARARRLRTLAESVDRALPRLALEGATPRDVLRAVELLHDEQRVETRDQPEDRDGRPEGAFYLPRLADRVGDGD